jgi:hypothetical protein
LVSVSSSGVLSGLAAGWSIVPRSGLDTPRAVVSSNFPTVDQDIKFTGWEIIDSAQYNDTNKFAVVVVFSWTTTPTINIDSISLNKGDLPTRPAPQTASDVLSECQYYYENSYDSGVYPGAASTLGSLVNQQAVIYNAPNSFTWTRTFGLQFKTKKRTAPTVTIYSVNGTIDTVQLNTYDAGAQTGTQQGTITLGWTQFSDGDSGVNFQSISTTAFATAGAGTSETREVVIQYHYVADCRLGVIA